MESLMTATTMAAALSARAQAVEAEAFARGGAAVAMPGWARRVAGVGLGLSLQADGSVRKVFSLNDVNLPGRRADLVAPISALYAQIIDLLTGAGWELVGGGRVQAMGAAETTAAEEQRGDTDVHDEHLPAAIQSHEEDLVRASLAGDAKRMSGPGVKAVVGVPQNTVCGRCVVRLMTSEPQPLPAGWEHRHGAGEGAEHALVSPIKPEDETRMLVLGQALAKAVGK
jgi:hypothetical protein